MTAPASGFSTPSQPPREGAVKTRSQAEVSRHGQPLERRGALLAFDFGTRRIGVAVGDWETRLAHPLEVIDAPDNASRFGRIATLIEEWRPADLVVGLPFGMDGEEHELSRRARRFANQLHGRFGLPVTLVDERLTSFDAGLRLREAGVKGRLRKGQDDTLAAQQILQDFLDRSTRETADATALA